jgi:hypothetical protein
LLVTFFPHVHVLLHCIAAYQRKLEERRRLAEENAKQLAREEHDDVTKKGGGAAIASFYGNFSRNVAMGAATTTEQQSDDLQDEEAEGGMDDPTELGATGMNNESKSARPQRESERSRGDGHLREVLVPGSGETKPPPEDLSPAEKNLQMREARAEKLAKARLRYFQRNGILPKGVASS